MSSVRIGPAEDRRRKLERIPGVALLAASWASVAIAILSFAMLLWTHQTGRSLGMADTLSQLSWARAKYSTGVAISRMQHDAPGYLS